VMNITREDVLKSDTGRKPVDFRSQFKFGRVTTTNCSHTLGLMPNAQNGCDAVSDSLVSALGLTWNQSAALMGAHTLGGMSVETSGYIGRWTSGDSSPFSTMIIMYRLFSQAGHLSLVSMVMRTKPSGSVLTLVLTKTPAWKQCWTATCACIITCSTSK